MSEARASRFVESGKPRGIRVSFEFFPPKTAEMEQSLWEAINRLAPLKPNFVSVTYGAGGSTRERTHATVKRILAETDADAGRASDLRRRDLRRDRRRDRRLCPRPASAISWRCAATRRPAPASAMRRIPAATATPPNSSPASRSASSPTSKCRCRPIRKSIPTARRFDADIDMLKAKVDAGATRAITQFFFENDLYFRYLDRVRAARHRYPDRARHHADAEFQDRQKLSPRAAAPRCRPGSPKNSMASTTMPRPASWSPPRSPPGRCSTWSITASTDFHFYTMNRADLVYAICHLLGLRPSTAHGTGAPLPRRRSARESMVRPRQNHPQPKPRCAGSPPSAFWCSTAPWAP